MARGALRAPVKTEGSSHCTAVPRAAVPRAIGQGQARDPARLAASLEEFAGHPAYGLDQLRDDLERFAFLPGGSDGESLFSPPCLT